MRLLIFFLFLNIAYFNAVAGEPVSAKKTPPRYAEGADVFHDSMLRHICVLPNEAYKTCVRGVVVIRFRIKTDGTIDSLETRHSVDDILDNHAAGFVLRTNGKWKAGEIDGVPVAMRKTLLFPYTVTTLSDAKPVHLAMSGVRINERVRLLAQDCPDGDYFYKLGVQAYRKGKFEEAWWHFNEANKRDFVYLDAIGMLKETADMLGKPCDVCAKLSLMWEHSEYEIKRVRDKYCTRDFKPLDASIHASRIYESVNRMPWPKFHAVSFAAANLQYPETSRSNCSQGTVLTRFTVMADGSVDSVITLFSVDPEIDAEAGRIVRKTSGMWEPGSVDGIPVNVYHTLPVTFSLNDARCKSADWYYTEGEKLYEQDKLTEALNHFAEAFKMDYSNHQAGYNYAAVAISLGKKEDACSTLQFLAEVGFTDAAELAQQYCK